MLKQCKYNATNKLAVNNKAVLHATLFCFSIRTCRNSFAKEKRETSRKNSCAPIHPKKLQNLFEVRLLLQKKKKHCFTCFETKAKERTPSI